MSRYDDEEFLPWYRRPTVGWLELSAAARGVLVSISMELNPKNGTLVLRRGLPSLAVLLRLPWETIEPAVAELIATEKLSWNGSTFTLSDPEYLARKRPTSTQRVQKLRRAQREAAANDSGNSCNAGNVTPVSATQRRGEEKREDPSPAEKGGERASAQAPSPVGPKRVLREDEPFTDKRAAYVETVRMNSGAVLDGPRVWRDFVNDRIAKTLLFASAAAVDADWRKWVDRQVDFAAEKRQRARGADLTKQPYDPDAPWLKAAGGDD